jgi:hypothetical protein
MKAPVGYMQNVYVKERLFIYTAVFSEVAIGAKSITQIQFSADSHFVCQKMTGNIQVDNLNTWQTATAQTAQQPATILFTDQQGGNVMFNNAMQYANIFGSGMFPFVRRNTHVLEKPVVFLPSTTLTIEFTNQSTRAAYRAVKLSLIGVKHYNDERG